MQNYKAPGYVLTLTAPADVDAGGGAKVGAIFGVAVNDVASGDAGEFATEGVFELNKVGSQAWAVGDRVYWDNSSSPKRCTTDATAGMFIGYATEAVGDGAGALLGKVKLASASPLLEGAQTNLAALTMDAGITAATANGALVGSAGANPTQAEFNELAKELATRINAIVAALVAAGIIAAP